MNVFVKKDLFHRGYNAYAKDLIWGHIVIDVLINLIRNGLMGCVNVMRAIVKFMEYVCQMELILEMMIHQDVVQEHILIQPNVDAYLVLSAV